MCFSQMKKTYYILFIIVLFSIFLRSFQLSSIPNGFYCDEAAKGYSAYSILTTGKDIDGRTLPVYFKHIANDFHGGIYTYSMVPFIAVFGLNEFAVRITSVFWGVLTVFLLFLSRQIRDL